MASRAEEQEFWAEFLTHYQELPALWKIKSESYKNRAAKTENYVEMVEKLKEIDPNANRTIVVKKINSFRSNYRRELVRLLM